MVDLVTPALRIYSYFLGHNPRAAARRLDEIEGFFSFYASALVIAEEYNHFLRNSSEGDVSQEFLDTINRFFDEYNCSIRGIRERRPTTLVPIERDPQGEYIIPELDNLPPELEERVRSARVHRSSTTIHIGMGQAHLGFGRD